MARKLPDSFLKHDPKVKNRAKLAKIKARMIAQQEKRTLKKNKTALRGFKKRQTTLKGPRKCKSTHYSLKNGKKRCLSVKAANQKHMKAACLKHNPTFIYRKHPKEKSKCHPRRSKKNPNPKKRKSKKSKKSTEYIDDILDDKSIETDEYLAHQEKKRNLYDRNLVRESLGLSKLKVLRPTSMQNAMGGLLPADYD